MIINYNQYNIELNCKNKVIKQNIISNFNEINDNFYDICIKILENLIIHNIILNDLNVSYNKNVYLKISNALYQYNDFTFKNVYYELHIYDLSYNNLINSNDINYIYNLIISKINSIKKKME